MMYTEFIFYFLEALIIFFTTFKYFKIKKPWPVYVALSTLYAITGYISGYYFVYNLFFTVLATIFTIFILDGFDKQYSIYEKIFISILVQLVVSVCSSLSLFKALFIFEVQGDAILFRNDIYYYGFSIISRILIFIILKKLLSNHLLDTSKTSIKYWNGLSILSFTILILSFYMSELVFTNSVHYSHVYFIMICYILLLLIIFYLFMTLKKESEKKMKSDIEMMQLKLIQEQYIALENQKQRNEKIKHDLEYFLEMINTRKKKEDIETVLLNTIKNIEEQDIMIFSKNKILNSLLIKIKEIGLQYHKKIMFDIQVNEVDISLTLYNQIINFTEYLCPNSLRDEIVVNINQVNEYCVFEYIYEPIQEITYNDLQEDAIVTHEKISNKDVIRFIIITE